MSLLYDKDLLKRLSREIRRNNPEDWKASRALRRARWWAEVHWGEIASMVFVLLTWVSALGVAFHMKSPPVVRLEAAAGLTGLNFFSLGLFMAGVWSKAPQVQLSPLALTPASGRWVYLYVLSCFRRTMAWQGLGILVMGAFFMVFSRLILGQDLSWNLLLPLAASGASAMGISIALGMGTLRILERSKRGLLALSLGLLFIFAWMFLKCLFSGTPDPQFVGDALFFLPQSKLLHWMAAGGAFPWSSFLTCTAGLLLAIFLAGEHARDRGEAFADELPEDPEEWRAESLVAAAAKEWHQTLQERALADDESEEEMRAEEAEEEEDVDRVKPPLFAHQDAPEMHNAPVTAEFRKVMAARLGDLMALPDQKLFSRAGLIGPTSSGHLRLMLRWGLASGICLPMLAEVASWFPRTWPEHYAGWLTAIAFVLAGLPLISTHRSYPVPYSLSAGNWMKIPVDIRVWTRGFFAWRRSWFLQRCLLVMTILSGTASSALLIISLREWTGWNTASPVVMERLTHGIISLPVFASLLLITVIGMRHLEAMTFFGALFRPLQLRGIWSGMSMMYAVWVLLSAVALFGALSMVGMSAEELWKGREWVDGLLWLLAAEVVHLLNVQFAVQVAKRVRAELKEG